MPPALEGVFGRYALQFFADSSGLKLDLDKLELQATAKATHIEKSFATGFTGGVEKARESVGSLTEFVGRGMGQVAGYLSHPIVAIGAIAAALGAFALSSVKSAIQFEGAFRQVRVVLGDTAKDMDDLKAKTLAVTPSMASAAQEAESLASVLAVGFKEPEALKILDTAAKLSRVTGVDLRTSVESLTETLHAYGLEAGSAARVSNLFLGIARTAGGPQGMQEVMNVMGRVNPLAAELGISMEQVGAALATFTSQGLPAGRAAQALAMILSSATGRAQEFRDANIDIVKVAKEQGILGVMRAISQLSGGTVEDMKKLGFETRAIQVIFALAGEKAGVFSEKLKEMQKSDLDATNTKMRDLTASTMDLNKAWEEFKIAVGEIAVPILAKLAQAAAEAAKGLAHPVATIQRLSRPVLMTGLRAGWRIRSMLGLSGGPPEEAAAPGEPATEALAAGAPAAAPKPVDVGNLPIAQRAAMRTAIESQGAAWTARLKLAQDAETKEIALDKQLAEARKTSALDLLQFDRKTLDTQFRYEETQRKYRLQVIAKELPLLKENIAAEKAERYKLLEEQAKLQYEEQESKKTHEKQLTLIAAKETEERIKILDAQAAAGKTMGTQTLQEEVDRLRQRSLRFASGSAERIAADAEAFKAAQDMVDRHFAHEEAMGRKSLQDAIDQAKVKRDAAVAGSEARMKAEEDVYKKEEELRNKRQTAALGILGEVKERMEARGVDTSMVTREDVTREMQDLQRERAQKAMVAQRFAAGGAASLEDVIGGYTAVGQLSTAQQQMAQLGGTQDILAGGAQMGEGPLTKSLGAFGDALTKPIAGIGDAFGTAMDAAFAAVDAGLGKIEERMNVSSSRIAKTVQENMEQWFVDKLMREAARN